MSSSTAEIIGGIAAAIGAAVAGVFVGRRQNSGRIDTSEASVLWQAAEHFRMEQRDRITELERRVESLEEEHRRCQEQLTALLKRT